MLMQRAKLTHFLAFYFRKNFCYRNYKCELYKLQNEQEILNLRIFGFLALILEKSKTFCLFAFLPFAIFVQCEHQK